MDGEDFTLLSIINSRESLIDVWNFTKKKFFGELVINISRDILITALM